MPPLTPQDYLQSLRDAKDYRVELGKNAGFEYNQWQKRQPVQWFDQFFAMDVPFPNPVIATESLRVGDILGAAEVALIAHGTNTGDLYIPDGASFLFRVYGADDRSLPFVEVYRALDIVPAGGSFSAGPSSTIARVALPQSLPKWIQVNVRLTAPASNPFTGIGTVDSVLVYNVR